MLMIATKKSERFIQAQRSEKRKKYEAYLFGRRKNCLTNEMLNDTQKSHTFQFTKITQILCFEHVSAAVVAVIADVQSNENAVVAR